MLVEDAFPDAIKKVYGLRVNRVIQKIHGLGKKRSALCFSGGGTRSGTFALGIIQSLAKHRLLGEFDYLSTVSGGGYIGGWLTAWIHRHPEGLEGVIKDLNGETRSSKLEPEPEPLRHLREYSNFITPRTGILSADSWTFIVIYIRNLLLNWLVLMPLLASILMIPRVANAVTLAQPRWSVLAGLLLLGSVGIFLLKWSRKLALRLIVVNIILLTIIFLSSGGWFAWLFAGIVARAPSFLAWPLSPLARLTWNALTGLLVMGMLLGSFAMAYMRLSRPSNSGAMRPGSYWAKHSDQNSFLWMCLLPLSLSAVLPTTFWAWYSKLGYGASTSLWEFLIYGLSLGLLASLMYALIASSTWWRDKGKAVSTTRERLELRRKAAALEKQLAALRQEKVERGKEWQSLEKKTQAELEDVRGKHDQLRKQGREIGAKVAWHALSEIGVTLLASTLGALLLWVAATKIEFFYAPVNYALKAVEYKDTFKRELLPPSDWWHAEIYTCLAFPVYLLIFFLGITLFVGFTSRRSEWSPEEKRARYKDKKAEQKSKSQSLKSRARDIFKLDAIYIEDEDREWLARASAWIFITMLAWLLFSALVAFGPLLFFALPKWLTAVGGISGLLTILGGRSALSPGNSKDEGKQSLLATLGVNVLVVASFVFFAFLVIVLSLLTGTVVAWLAKYLPSYLFGFSYLLERWPSGWPWDGVRAIIEIPAEQLTNFREFYPLASDENVFRVMNFPTWLFLLALAVALQAFGQLSSRLINLNKFSLHAGYRDRIIRAFLGASRLKGERRENPFTGFDPRDNLYMAELRPGLLSESDFKAPDGLENFVKHLNEAAVKQAPADKQTVQEVEAADGLVEDKQTPANAQTPAAYLRQKITESDGESARYFKDPHVHIPLDSTFRSAFFADLNLILQDKAAPLYADGTPFAYLKETWRVKAILNLPDWQKRGDYHILLNRLLLELAFDDCIVPSKYPPPPYRLLHVVNMALNLVGGKRLAWQQRRAESFTATALHSGSLFVGYRRTRHYGGKSGIALGTAVAISGAAASSNMGYFSPSPFVTFVLTIFNARLGWWLGNPGVHGADTFYLSHPEKALSPIIDEAFGMTDDENPYVLLSDGGHFENLALYEMVLRRCHNIVVIDGSADPKGTLEGLGDAVRKIRIDMGIPIEFKSPFPILPRPESENPDKQKSGGYCAVGDIHYEVVDAPDGGGATAADGTHERHEMTGRLIYIKPTIYGSEPRDIFNYAKSHPTFPHESTADQFFDEPQFESHRMLGYYILEQLCEEAGTSPDGGPCKSGDLQKFINWLDERAKPARQQAGDDESQPDVGD
ncbi:MAG: patatin-like phospholipase family protein [Rubrivivax sp.]|nr:patatin-like phospholipase family protein [Pyrinomonadaceae bacterium]